MKGENLTLRALLHRAASQYPDREAICDAVCRYTYRELHEAVRRTAQLLRESGVRKGDRVALIAPASTSHAIALLGTLELGAIPCSLHVRESAETLASICRRLSPRVLVYDGAFAETAAALRKHVPFFTAFVRTRSDLPVDEAAIGRKDPVVPDDLARYDGNFEPMPLAAHDYAVIALSSGTTSLPKGVLHTHRTLVASARVGARYLQTGDRTCSISAFSTAFIGWYNMYLPFLYAAAKVVFLSRFDPERFLNAIAQEQVTVCFLVPTMWRMLLAEDIDDHDLSSIRLVGYAGEPMDAATARRIAEQICPNLINTYGTTETGSWGGCTVMLPEDFRCGRGTGSVGRPADGVEIRIVDPDGSIDDIVAPGEEGEVIVAGPSVAREIWEQPDVARTIFDGRWWRSRDLGVLDDDGYLYLRGRIDDMIISGGINVQPSAVEEVLLSHPAVGECAVVGLPDDEWGQRITAFVIGRGNLTAADLRAHVDRSGLSRYKHPRDYRFVDELPRGNTGKVLRRALRQR